MGAGEMATVSVPRARVADGSLPSVCVVCGADAPHRRFPNVGAPSLAWVLFSPLVGLLTFWVYILLTSRSLQEGGLPFCDRHRGYWTRRATVIVFGFLTMVVLMGVGMALLPPEQSGVRQPPNPVAAVAGCWVLLYLPTFLILQLTATRPTGRTRKSLKISGASRKFAAAVAAEKADTSDARRPTGTG